MTSANARPDYIGKRASVLIALLFAAFFGPLGLLYASVPGALVTGVLWLLLAAIEFLITFFLSPGILATIIVWPICVIWAFLAAARRKRFVQDAWLAGRPV